MALDPEYIDAIKTSEGYSPAAAWDYKQNSSGYGTKAQPGDENIPPDQLRAVHEQRFQDEIAKAQAHVDSVNPNLPAGARAALTSLTYNAGPGWSQSGLGDLVRSGDLQGAQERFLQYNKAGGEVNPALVARRGREAAWFTQQPQPAPMTPGGLLQQGGGLLPGNAPPLNLAPQAAPIFAPPPQARPQQAQQEQAAPPDQFQVPQAPPIFFAPRKSPDLTKLRAAVGRPAYFGRG